MARYEHALQQLTEADRTAFIARLEMKCDYEEIAVMLGKPSTAAARQTVSRALRRLAEFMGHGR